jgi:hypothetical protein
MVVDTTVPLPAHEMWSRIFNIYHDNAETCSSYLEQEFYGLQQGSMTVTDYCRNRRFSRTSSTSSARSSPKKRLVQNTLRGLGSRLAYIRTLTLQQRPLPPFLDVRSSLLLEELTLQKSESLLASSPPYGFVAHGAPTHPPRGPVGNTVPPRRPDVCRNFQHFGNCRFSARCRFLHIALIHNSLDLTIHTHTHTRDCRFSQRKNSERR